MDHLRRLSLAGALMLVVAGVAAPPASAAVNPWEQQCVDAGGTFSMKQLGGQAVEYECTNLPPPAPVPQFVAICKRFPDYRGSSGTFSLGSGRDTVRCKRDGEANVKVTLSPKMFLDGATSQLEVVVNFNCDSRYPETTIVVQVQQRNVTVSGSRTVPCFDGWEEISILLPAGGLSLGRADVFVSGSIEGVLGDTDARNLEIVSS